MTDETNTKTIRVTDFSRRVGAASPRGCIIAVEYIVEGEPGMNMEWLDEFLDEHTDGIEVGSFE